MQQLQAFLSRFTFDEAGQDLIEYALAAALIGLAAVTSMRSLATHISNAFTSIGTGVSSAV